MRNNITILVTLFTLVFLAITGLQVEVEAAEVPAVPEPAANATEEDMSVASTLTNTIRYTITDLGTLGGKSSYAAAVNEHGQVVGYRQADDLSFRAFLWEDGTMSDLNTPDGMDSFANDIDDDGRIVGLVRDSSLFRQAVRWEQGSLIYLDSEWSSAAALNDSGHIAGQVLVDQENLYHHAVTWQGASKTVLGTLGETWSGATAINDGGQVVGSYDSSGDGSSGIRGFLWENGGMVDIGVDFGGGHSEANDINDAGDIVGASMLTEGGLRSFLKQADGTVVDLGTIGDNSGRAYAVNNDSQVVGSAGGVAFLWENGTLTDLNDRIDPDAGWVLKSAEDINDAGQIVGYGLHDGQARAFLLTPEQPAWTVMFYLDGDNDLAGTQPPILNQLELAANNSNANVVVLWDGADAGDSAYIEVQHDTDLSNSFGYTEGENYWDQGELDMSLPSTLTDFVTWAMSNYPAQHYALFLTDHGSGLGGGLIDDAGGGFHMYLDGIQQALLDTPTLVGEPLDVLYLDMCLMGMLEVGYEVRDYTDYMVASEYLQWGVSAPYFDYVDGIDADTTPEALAAHFAGTYAATVAPDDLPYTISAVKMNELDNLVAATDALALALQTNMEAIAFILSDVADEVQRYDMNGDGTVDTDDSYADLYHLATLIEQQMPDYPEIVAEAQAVQTAMLGYVISEANGSSEAVDLANSRGVSIFFPTSAGSYYDGFNNDFAAGTDWGSVVPSSASVEGVAWGPMLVDYIQQVNPDGPDESEPPAPVGRLLPQAGTVYLPMALSP